MHLWYDGKSGQTRVETLGGLDLTLDLKVITLLPRVDQYMLHQMQENSLCRCLRLLRLMVFSRMSNMK